MIRRMSFKQFLFILPLLVLVAVFSLYPIVSSFMYTVFDYRVFDQQYSKMYVSGSFNTELFYQDCQYLVRNLQDDATVVDEAAQAEYMALADEIADYMAEYEGQAGTRKISGAEAEKLEAFVNDTEAKINRLYAANPGADFYHKEDMSVLLAEIRTCFISPNFVGVQNYQRLFSDTRFWKALGTTFLFMVVTVTFEFVLGMALALIMNKAMRGIGLVRTTALVPWAIPTAVSALIWSYLYDAKNGIVSYAFQMFGFIEKTKVMTATAAGSMVSAIIADVWKTTPYMALLLLAGLQTIDRGLYESSSIDGSGTVNTFFKITLPLMKPSILVALLFRMLDAFRVYDLLAILTNGVTESLSVYSYKLMIGQGYYGYGSVVVIAMFVCVALIAFFFVKVMGAEVISNED